MMGGDGVFAPPPLFKNGGGEFSSICPNRGVHSDFGPPHDGGCQIANGGFQKNVIFWAWPPPIMGGDKPKNGDFRHFLAENRHFGAQFFLAPSIMGGAKKYFPPSWGGNFFAVCISKNLTSHFFCCLHLTTSWGGNFFSWPPPTMGGERHLWVRLGIRLGSEVRLGD